VGEEVTARDLGTSIGRHLRGFLDQLPSAIVAYSFAIGSVALATIMVRLAIGV